MSITKITSKLVRLLDGSDLGDAIPGRGLSNELSSKDELRSLLTKKQGQTATLKTVVAGGPIVDARYHHSPGSTLPDDDYSTIVTNEGQRYIADCSEGINYKLSGVLLNGSNAGECIKRIVDNEVSKAILGGKLSYCKKVINISPLGNDDSTQLILDTSATFKLPSFISLQHKGHVRYKFNGLNNPAFRITNEIPGLTSSMSDFVDLQGAEVLKGNGYPVDVCGPNPMSRDQWAAVPVGQRSNSAAVEFGNTYSAGSLLDVRDTIISNLVLRGFKAGIQWHGYDTYINNFRDLNIVSCEYSFYGPTADKSNSGEKVVFDVGVAGNCFRSHFYWNQVGMSMTFRSWSFDYAYESVLELHSSGRGNDFVFENCWFEGWGDFLIRQYPITTTWSFRKNKIVFSNSHIVGAKRSQSEWAPRRKIILAPTDNNVIEFINTPIEWPSPPSEPHIALMGYTDDTIKYNKAKFECPINPFDDELLNYAYGLNGDGYKFSGSQGANLKNASDAQTNISFDTNDNDAGFTVVYGPVGSDGLQEVIITTTSTSQLVELSNKKICNLVGRGAVVNGGLSIKMSGVVSGQVNFGCRLKSYKSLGFTNNPGTNVVTEGFQLVGSLSSDAYNVTALLSATGTPLTTGDFVGVQVAREFTFAPHQATHFTPTLTVSGYVGTISVKLPVWWISQGTDAGASIKGVA